MSTSLLNTGSAVSLPFLSGKITKGFQPLQGSLGRRRNCSTGITCCYNTNRENITAVSGGERRDSLDYLQRASKAQPPKKGTPQGPQPQVAPIGLWDRFPTARTVQQMMDTMERIMEDPLAYSSTWPSAAMPREDYGGYRRGRTPWEIKEMKNEYKMRFDVPGMTKEDVKVWVEEKMLVVKAEKVSKSGEVGADSAGSDEDGGADWSPKSYGRYSSRIALPENVEIEKIKAEVRDGVLYISLPKADASSKIVDINVQ
ncbi:hypothetical protein Sjap_016377 [Stephania japonica]|uniref:SHSP domain-containing protein n=1 Tax=Stephania japonica TaxID=461633 RepID=A0AAP0NTQ8_9MAGN